VSGDREMLAAALREKAAEAHATPCDMDCDLSDCPSCGQPIQAFSLIGGVPEAIFGAADDIVDALLPVVDRIARARAAAELREAAEGINGGASLASLPVAVRQALGVAAGVVHARAAALDPT
jgi:hypothetical protein